MTRVHRLIVLVGLPGSGKSTWAREQKLPVLSSDETRVLLADNMLDQTIHRHVFRTLRFLIRQRIEVGRPVTCVDATHLTPRERAPYRRIKGCRMEAVYFDVPLEVCQMRNRARDRVVPPEVIEAMARRLAPPALEEGFALITIVRPEGTATVGEPWSTTEERATESSCPPQS